MRTADDTYISEDDELYLVDALIGHFHGRRMAAVERVWLVKLRRFIFDRQQLAAKSPNLTYDKNQHVTGVHEAVETHRRAVIADEASFDDLGRSLSRSLAHKTFEAEVAAYLAMVSAPCATAEDVQLKLDYVPNGSVGERTTLVECLDAEEYGGSATLQAFLCSLFLGCRC